MAALWLLVVTVVLALWLLQLLYRRLLFSRAFRFPGPRAWPVIGNALLLTGSQSEFFRLIQRLGGQNPGGVFQLWVGMRPFVFLYKSSTIKPLVTSSVHLEKNFEYSLTQDWLGNGLITSKGDLWQKQRKMLTPCFHFNILKEFSVPVWRHGQVLLRKLSVSGGSSVDIVPLAKLLALDIICETAMGIDIGTQANSDSEYPAAISRMTDILCHRFITPWMKPSLLFYLTANGREYRKLLNKVQEFVKQIIMKRKFEVTEHTLVIPPNEKEGNKNSEELQTLFEPLPNDSFATVGEIKESVKVGVPEIQHADLCRDCQSPTCKTDPLKSSRRRLALLDFLLKLSQDDPTITDQDITDQVNTFMFAGHDTISCAISFTLFVFGHHPEWQDAVVEEIDRECPDLLTVEPETRQCLKGFPVLDRCLKEAMRLYPPSPMVGRTIDTPLDTPGGTLPVGTTAIIYTYLLHRDPTVFHSPDSFDPNRFLPENCPQDPFAYLPFSAGPRNCIGKSLALLEIKIVLAMVLKTFRVTSLQTPEELDLSFEIVLTNKRGINLCFTPRN